MAKPPFGILYTRSAAAGVESDGILAANRRGMARIHILAGSLVLAVFALTGQVMAHHVPPMASLNDAGRLMFRSRHIYILAAGLVNLMLGLYVRPRPRGWRRIVQAIGSGFLLLAPALLIAAFFREPERGFQSDLPWSAYGLFSLLFGAIGHTVSAPALRR